jgi:hypothetical protein
VSPLIPIAFKIVFGVASTKGIKYNESKVARKNPTKRSKKQQIGEKLELTIWTAKLCYSVNEPVVQLGGPPETGFGVAPCVTRADSWQIHPFERALKEPSFFRKHRASPLSRALYLAVSSLFHPLSVQKPERWMGKERGEGRGENGN